MTSLLVSHVTSLDNYCECNIVCVCTYVASGGTDFTFAPRNVTFPVGETSYTIDVEINDDNIFELGNETFSLSLTSVIFPQSLPVTIANDITTVVILDDDRKYTSLLST